MIEFSAPPDSSHFAEGDSALRVQAQSLRALFVSALERPAEELAAVAGNLLVHVPNVATWTIVTSGARRGVHDGLTDDAVGFALWCEGNVMFELFGGKVPGELDPGAVRWHGEPEIFARFVALL